MKPRLATVLSALTLCFCAACGAGAPVADVAIAADEASPDDAIDVVIEQPRALADAHVDDARDASPALDAPAEDSALNMPEAEPRDVPAGDARSDEGFDVPSVDGPPDAVDVLPVDAPADAARDAAIDVPRDAPRDATTDAPSDAAPTGDAPAGALAVLSAGGAHTCSITPASATKCWGSGTAGQLGAGTRETCTFRTTPCSRTAVTIASLTTATQIAAGGEHTLATMADGTVRSWGDNTGGQLGSGGTTNRTTPAAVPMLTGVVTVAAGAMHSCAVLRDETVRCWGLNTSGQVGTMPATVGLMCTVSGARRPCVLSPAAVAGLTGVRELALGSNHTCARLADGTVRCWGSNAYGQLGDGSTGTRFTPGVVPGLNSVVQLTAGALHTCAVLADGTARCWGLNTLAGLGDGTRTQRDAPTPVVGLTDALQLTGGAYHTCVRLADGTARCWGMNGDGRLGATSTSRCIDGGGTSQPCSLTPIEVTGLRDVQWIAAGNYHTCALQSGGVVQCWGSANEGQIGRGTVSYGWSDTPMNVVGVP